jgi:putative ABC transport system permease protein
MPLRVPRSIAALREPTRIAFDSMRLHKLRTFLTLLGVILSVSTLIVVIAMVEGTNKYIADKVANLGADVFLVNQYGIIPDRKSFLKAQRTNKPVTYEDFEALRDNMTLPKAVGLEARTTGIVKFGTNSLEDVDVRGVTANIGDMDVEEPEFGRYISDADDSHRSEVTLIGADVASKFFPGLDPLGKTIEIDGRPFLIVGVAKAIGNVLGQSQDNFVYMPVQTFLKIYGNNFRGLSINVQGRGAQWAIQTQEEARTLMRVRRHLAPGQDDTFGISSAAGLMDLWSSISSAIEGAMVGVVGVFLVIGGVVIMNVMLTSVTERTREIGIRKSLGAKRHDIMLQFLLESAMMSALGGLIGLGLAAVLSKIVDATTAIPMSLPVYAIVLGISVSTAVGLFFGIYPARKAARLDPIEAMRHE